MRIVAFGPTYRVGALVNGQVIDLSRAARLRNAVLPSTLQELIEGGDAALDIAETAVEHALRSAADARVDDQPVVQPLAAVRIQRPQPSLATRIACAGGNYAQHSAGMGTGMPGGQRRTPEEAYQYIRNAGYWGFWKVPHETAGPEDDVIYPARTERLDYEGEVAVVLGKRAKDVKAADGGSYFWGLTLHFDYSIRDRRDAPMPMTFALNKNFDTSSALGPCIAVREADPHDVRVQTRVNGEVRQDYNTRDMVFSFEDFLEYLTRDLTLYPGDMISGGSGAGTAMDSTPRGADGFIPPERFLKVGDTVEVESASIGLLRNRIIAKPA
jgi:acylpyruvate hydrolase